MTSVVLANSQVATVQFLSLAFFFGLFVMPTARTGGPILMISVSHDVFKHKDVPFGGYVDTAPHLRGHIPQKSQFVLRPNVQKSELPYYENYCIDSNQILHKDKDHQILFVAVPHECQQS